LEKVFHPNRTKAMLRIAVDQLRDTLLDCYLMSVVSGMPEHIAAMRERLSDTQNLQVN